MEILLDKGTGLDRTANKDKVAWRSSATNPGAALVESTTSDGSATATLAEQRLQTAGIGALSDSAATNSTSNSSMIALLKGVFGKWLPKTWINSSGAVNSLVVSAAPAVLHSITITTSLSQYLHIHNAITQPGNGATPLQSIWVNAGSLKYVFGEGGKSFSSGIVVCNSSTMTTTTIGAADSMFAVEYK
jgi:hypothetical protein